MNFSRTSLAHLSRNVFQRMFTPDVGVIGGYHGGNLGDMAMGHAVAGMLSTKGIKTGLQTIYNLNKWPFVPRAIVGGGAVGYIASLNQVALRYKGAYNKVALLGVDFNEKIYSDACLDLIRNAAFVSCRSQEQANRLAQLTGRQHVFHHPDIAFSLMKEFSAGQRRSAASKTKKLLVNIVPLYGKMQDGKLIPVAQYKEERSELYGNFNVMQESYIKVIRRSVEDALQQGYQVETIPFTFWDAAYGKIVLKGLGVKHASYQSDPSRMLKRMAGAERILATRFHATIFALKAGTKISPIAYATKNEIMLQELGVNRSCYLTTGDLANGIAEMPEPIRVDADLIDSWEEEARQAISNCISVLE